MRGLVAVGVPFLIRHSTLIMKLTQFLNLFNKNIFIGRVLLKYNNSIDYEKIALLHKKLLEILLCLQFVKVGVIRVCGTAVFEENLLQNTEF